MLLATAQIEAAVGQVRLSELHSFVVLAEELSFTKAARRLLVTTEGLSRRIAHLESAVGQTLVRRSTHSVGLTSAGAALVPALTRMMAEVQSINRPCGVGSV